LSDRVPRHAGKAAHPQYWYCSFPARCAVLGVIGLAHLGQFGAAAANTSGRPGASRIFLVELLILTSNLLFMSTDSASLFHAAP
jgi:hypothetical protein